MNDGVVRNPIHVRWKDGAAAALVLLAGVLAFLTYAAGDFGPMVVFGAGDARHGARSAWIQLPLHGFIAVAIVASGLQRAALVLLAALMAWVVLLTYFFLAGLSQGYTDLLDVALAASLLNAYAAAAYLIWDGVRHGS